MKVTYSNCKNFISAKEIILGENVDIKEGTFISAIGGECEKVVIGDNVSIDKDCVILVPEFHVGDYGKIFKFVRITGYKPCKIGHNLYCDSNVILNAAENLTIGNNFGIGAYSALWTHIKHGDVLEGCRFDYTKETVIEDDVWFLPSCVVSPIVARRRSMALAGSMVTKDMEENCIYAGSPAKNISDKIGPQFIQRTVDEKLKMMEKNLEDFSAMDSKAKEFIKIVPEYDKDLKEGISYYNVSDRTYTKTKSEIEVKFMRFLLPTAKFIPRSE